MATFEYNISDAWENIMDTLIKYKEPACLIKRNIYLTQ